MRTVAPLRGSSPPKKVTKVDTSGRCSRCLFPAERLIPPYWDQDHPICPLCCVELNAEHDAHGWPYNPFA